MDAPILIWLYRESLNNTVSENAGFNNTIFELKKQSNESISTYQNKNPSE